MDALFPHALPGARVSRLCSPVAYRALARRSEQPTKQVTLALLRREPGAQSEHVTDLGQTLTQRQGRWLSITPGHCGVALLAAFSCRQTVKSEMQEGTGEGTLEPRPGSHLLSLVSWDSQNYPEFQGGAQTTEDPGLGVMIPGSSARSLDFLLCGPG